MLSKKLIALIAAMVISFAVTPVVKEFAKRVGAMDVPKDERRMHKVPIPRMGGLAIFLGFLLSILVLLDLRGPIRGMLLGAVIIVVVGVIDDIKPLPALIKFALQILAALVAVESGIVVRVISNPNIFSANPYLSLGILAVPITVIWIVAITNSVNLIDGLDGLAVGVTAIGSFALLVIAIAMAEKETAIIMAALAGACVGFMPYNVNPAKIFMGDTGATFLGYILATVSVIGLFKYYAIISFAVPFLILGLPIFDTSFAFFRRLLRGQNPMKADRGHVHHRLIDMGFNQKQAVAILYVISVILGLAGVVLTTSGAMKAMLFLGALCAAGVVGLEFFRIGRDRQNGANGKSAAQEQQWEPQDPTEANGAQEASEELSEEDKATPPE
jgi:UDP-GlcNAc:undecaprenyl-phosphate GlcNAc-1-phosphate transferase